MRLQKKMHRRRWSNVLMIEKPAFLNKVAVLSKFGDSFFLCKRKNEIPAAILKLHYCLNANKESFFQELKR